MLQYKKQRNPFKKQLNGVQQLICAVFVLVYLVDSPPADDPYGLDQVGEGRLRCQEDGALKVSTQEVGVIWSCAVRGEKIKHDNENLVWFCSFVVVCVCACTHFSVSLSTTCKQLAIGKSDAGWALKQSLPQINKFIFPETDASK